MPSPPVLAYEVPFAFPFRARMSSGQVAWLREELGLTFHSEPKFDSDLPYAFGLLDRASGLYLIEGEGDCWRLECRTYEEPAAELVEGWKARASWVVEAIARH